jgi:hypothetical protein
MRFFSEDADLMQLQGMPIAAKVFECDRFKKD